MKTSHKILIGIGITTGVIYLGTSIYKLVKENSNDKESKPSAKTDPYNSPSFHKNDKIAGRPKRYPKPTGDEFPLRLGSKGKRVERLQIWLMRNYGWTGKITSYLDEKTQELMKKYLKTDKLTENIYQDLEMGKPIYEQTITR